MQLGYLFTAISIFSYHVFNSRLEVAQKCFRLVSLDFTVLDGFSPQVVVHLDCKDGRRAALILAAEITCQTGTTDSLHVSPGPCFIPSVCACLPTQADSLLGGRAH